jgi:hypothetical protein
LVVAAGVLSGCNMLGVAKDEKPSPCEQNEDQCPTSQRLSTDVGCDCTCVAGYEGLTPTRDFSGVVPACLPSELNAKLATPEQLAALEALPAATFNQRVFKYCSDTIASYLNDLIEEQQRPADLTGMCMGPRIKCTCTTAGAKGQTATCSQACADKQCDSDNCGPFLRVGGAVDSSACQCSRVSTCNGLTPPEGSPPICLNRVAAILARRPN